LPTLLALVPARAAVKGGVTSTCQWLRVCGPLRAGTGAVIIVAAPPLLPPLLRPYCPPPLVRLPVAGGPPCLTAGRTPGASRRTARRAPMIRSSLTCYNVDEPPHARPPRRVHTRLLVALPLCAGAASVVAALAAPRTRRSMHSCCCCDSGAAARRHWRKLGAPCRSCCGAPCTPAAALLLRAGTGGCGPCRSRSARLAAPAPPPMPSCCCCCAPALAQGSAPRRPRCATSVVAALAAPRTRRSMPSCSCCGAAALPR
jgi:hypothetical protein